MDLFHTILQKFEILGMKNPSVARENCFVKILV